MTILLGLPLVVIPLLTLELERMGDEYHNTIARIFNKRIAINPDVIPENFIRITISMRSIMRGGVVDLRMSSTNALN